MGKNPPLRDNSFYPSFMIVPSAHSTRKASMGFDRTDFQVNNPISRITIIAKPIIE